MTKPSSRARRSPRGTVKHRSGNKVATFQQIPRDLASVIRGLYGRVAHRLHVDPSYVSRVARGERRSKTVEDSLRRELSRIFRGTGKRLERPSPKTGRNRRPPKSK